MGAGPLLCPLSRLRLRASSEGVGACAGAVGGAWGWGLKAYPSHTGAHLNPPYG